MADPDAMPPTTYTMDFFGLEYTGDLSRFIDWEIYFYGAYEPETLSLIDVLISASDDDLCFIDIGANAGQHSLFAARYGIRVVAFEPWAPARAQFRENIDRNHLSTIELQECALANSNCSQRFRVPIGNNSGTGRLLEDDRSANDSDTIDIQVCRGDDMMDRLAVIGPALLKIDVEGSERDVLAGLKSFISTHRPSVIMEFSDATRRCFEDTQHLLSFVGNGYSIESVRRVRDRHRLEPFDFNAPQGNILMTSRGT